MNRVFVLCLVVVLGCMFAMSSARILQSDTMKVSKHHEDSRKTKTAKSNGFPQGGDVPVHTSEDGYTVVTIPKTAEKHYLIDSLMNMFRNGSKVDHQALLVIAPQSYSTGGGDFFTKENATKIKTDVAVLENDQASKLSTNETTTIQNVTKIESDVAVLVHNNSKLSPNETTTIQIVTLPNNIDDQKTAESSRVDMGKWLGDNVLVMNGASESDKEIFIFMDDELRAHSLDLPKSDNGFINYDLNAIDNDSDRHHHHSSDHKASTRRHMKNSNTLPNSDLRFSESSLVPKFAEIEHPVDTVTPAEIVSSNNTTPSELKISETETSSKPTDIETPSELKVSDYETTSEVNVANISTPSELKASEIETTSEINVINTSPPSELTVSTISETPSELKVSSDPETTLELKVSTISETPSELKVSSDPETTSELKVSSDPETTSELKVSSDPETPSELKLSNSETTSDNTISDPSTTTQDLPSTDMTTSPSTPNEPTPTTSKAPSDNAPPQASQLNNFDSLTDDLSIISKSIDKPLNFEATDKILNDKGPLMDLCRESQQELMDVFNLGLEQLSSLFTAMYKKMSCATDQKTQ